MFYQRTMFSAVIYHRVTEDTETHRDENQFLAFFSVGLCELCDSVVCNLSE